MTEGSKPQEELSTRQQKAIDLLLLGRSDAEVAEQLGVGRIKVTEWRLYDPEFAMVLNGKRQGTSA